MSKYFEIRWHGRGGQGTVTGAKSLAEAVQGTGLYVIAFPEYGPERRGAPVKAFNRFYKDKIRIHSPVISPDVVIIVDPTLIGNTEVKIGISENTIFIINSEKSAETIKKELDLYSQKVFTVPADKISFQLFKREIPNSAMMGAFSRACGKIISIEKLIEESGHIFADILGKELVERNLEAIRKGFKEGDQA